MYIIYIYIYDDVEKNAKIVDSPFPTFSEWRNLPWLPSLPELSVQDLSPKKDIAIAGSSPEVAQAMEKMGNHPIVTTLWLCQNSYWKWPFIVDFPIENGDFPLKNGDL